MLLLQPEKKEKAVMIYIIKNNWLFICLYANLFSYLQSQIANYSNIIESINKLFIIGLLFYAH